ncbi:Putative calcium-dependent channel, 7TM region phosphate [Septoria linicola]|uniref:Calcium-dependent channel, 7TM region phosphate n=1 Tax=Septoria linicola TaxID=215465 RepID=A0A9Q9B779_9PEZI|nr:putative calcium-dependent channel, 7TM region phosphate [Septoria linicola]USW57641.1 Putative calcium-dependent channel, 7TM region phosphate [Septoria linicola]
MDFTILKDDGYGKNRREGSTSFEAILGAFIPTFIISVFYITIFLFIRNYFRKTYAPRTYLGTIPQKDRTPASHAEGKSWFHDFRSLKDRFVLKHNSLDAYLFLRFLKFIIVVCFAGACLTWPILFPINATGGGNASQLDRISFSNIAKNSHLWAHLVVAWVLFLGIFIVIAFERLRLIGIRQACYLNETYASRLSAKTVLFLNVPREALLSENLKEYFGQHAEQSWPVKDTGDLPDLVEKRNDAAYALEDAEYDFIVKNAKGQKSSARVASLDDPSVENGQGHSQTKHRPTTRQPVIVGQKVDRIEEARQKLLDIEERIEAVRAAPSRNIPGEGAVFVTFDSQEAAHRAFQQITFRKQLPLEDRYLAVQPKEVLWQNVQLPVANRLSKASLGLIFVIWFTIFFSIPVGLIGTLSNVNELADKVKFLSFLKDLPDWVLGLLVGFVPPAVVSWFVSYVPKLFRHIAKLSGEPTTPQAELKTQAWFMVFQVFQVFLVATFSSGAAAVATKIAKDPRSAPELLASSLPKASNFYLTYFILQGTTSAANNLLDYSELFEYLFYEYFWNKTPREKYQTYAQMRGTPWAAWYPKFTNFLIIATAYACVQPLILGFASVGVAMFYLSYRYALLYVRQTKIDTKGEAYKRALQQMPTGLYLAELCLIGLFGARKAAVQTALMIVLLVLTAIANLILDRMLQPLELYLGVDKWQAQEVPLLAEERGTHPDNIDPNDEAALHAASHGHRLGLNKLPGPAPRWASDFFDGIISSAREKTKSWLEEDDGTEGESFSLSDEDIKKAYIAPAFTSKTPKLWIPSDKYGISKLEIEQNEKEGIKTTDEAAEVDENGRLHWDHNFENVPVFAKPKLI